MNDRGEKTLLDIAKEKENLYKNNAINRTLSEADEAYKKAYIDACLQYNNTNQKKTNCDDDISPQQSALSETLYEYARFLKTYQNQLARLKDKKNRKFANLAISHLMAAAKLGNKRAIQEMIHCWLFNTSDHINKTHGDGYSFLASYTLDEHTFSKQVQEIAEDEKISHLLKNNKKDKTLSIENALSFLKNTAFKNPDNQARAVYLILCYQLHSEKHDLETRAIWINAALLRIQNLPSTSQLKSGLLNFIAFQYSQIAQEYLNDNEDRKNGHVQTKQYLDEALEIDENSIEAHNTLITYWKKMYEKSPDNSFSPLVSLLKNKFKLLDPISSHEPPAFLQMASCINELMLLQNKEKDEENSVILDNCIQELIQNLKNPLINYYTYNRISNTNIIYSLIENIKDLTTLKERDSLYDFKDEVSYILKLILDKLNIRLHILLTAEYRDFAAYQNACNDTRKRYSNAKALQEKNHDAALPQQIKEIKTLHSQMLYSFAKYLLTNMPGEDEKIVKTLTEAAELNHQGAKNELVYCWFFRTTRILSKHGDGFFCIKKYSPSLSDLFIQATKIKTNEKPKNKKIKNVIIYSDEQVLTFLSDKKHIKNPKNLIFAYYLLLCYYLRKNFNIQKAIYWVNAMLAKLNELKDPKYESLKKSLMKVIALIYFEIGKIYLGKNDPSIKNLKEAQHYFDLALNTNPKSDIITHGLIQIYKNKEDEHSSGFINFPRLNPLYIRKFNLLSLFVKKADFIQKLQAFHRELEVKNEEPRESLDSLNECIQKLILLLKKELIDFYQPDKISKYKTKEFKRANECVNALKTKNIDEDFNETLDLISENLNAQQSIFNAENSASDGKIDDALASLGLCENVEQLLVRARIHANPEKSPKFSLAVQDYHEILKKVDQKSKAFIEAKQELFIIAEHQSDDNNHLERPVGEKAAMVFCDYVRFPADETRINRLIELNYTTAMFAKGKWLVELANQYSSRGFISNLLSPTETLSSFTSLSKGLDFFLMALKTGDENVQKTALKHIFDFEKKHPSIIRKIEIKLIDLIRNDENIKKRLLALVESEEGFVEISKLGKLLKQYHPELFKTLTKPYLSLENYAGNISKDFDKEDKMLADWEIWGTEEQALTTTSSTEGIQSIYPQIKPTRAGYSPNAPIVYSAPPPPQEKSDNETKTPEKEREHTSNLDSQTEDGQNRTNGTAPEYPNFFDHSYISTPYTPDDKKESDRISSALGELLEKDKNAKP